jgi:hypothetical protein
VAFADCLRQEVAPHGIRVALIEPGAVDTPALSHLAGEGAGSIEELIPGVTPLDPSDVARAVRFVLEQPPNVNVFEVLLRPTNQLL